jgi:AraC family transcriptional activator of pobA
MEHRKVQFYADKLSVKAYYLSKVCAQNGDKSTREWIEYYTAKSLTMLLMNTDINLQEIAANLRFCTPSHFSNYARRIFGITPLKYRQQIFANVHSPETT